MMTTLNINDRKRPSLGEQIQRLDAILDGLADNLNEAVAMAVKAAVSVAVQEAVQAVMLEVLTNEELLKKLRPEPAMPCEPARTAAPPVIAKAQGWLSRLAGVAKAIAGKVVNLVQQVGVQVTQKARGCWETVRTHMQSGWQRLKMLAKNSRTLLSSIMAVVWQLRKPLLIAVGVGSVVGLGSYLAGPVVAATLSGLAGFAGSLVSSVVTGLRRALTGMDLPNC